MAKYSRMKRYQGLRESLDRETTQTQQPSTNKNLERLSRVASANQTLSHADQPQRKREENLHTVTQELPTSPVMDHLFDEVKQYNIENGNTISDDTQINILKQLDGTQVMHRNEHFMPMEQQEEDLGSTMELPVSKIQEKVNEKPKKQAADYEDGTDILPMRDEPLPVHPVVDEPVEEPKPEPETDKQTTKEKIVLTHDDFDFDEDDIDSQDFDEDEDVPARSERIEEDTVEEEKPVKKPKPKTKPKKVKKKKVKKQKKAKEKKPAKEAEPKAKNRTGTILNVVLIVLVILLVIAIAATYMMMKNLGA